MIFSVSFVFLALLNIGHQLSAEKQMSNSKCFNHGGKQFCGVEEPMNYTSADLHCKSFGMSLIKLDTEELNQLFIGKVMESNKIPFWIGLNDVNTEGKFVWSDGSELGRSYQNWNDTQPDDSRQNEDCVHLKTNGKWNDLPCFQKLMFICERRSVDGGFSKWSSWSSCGKTCGEANRERSRTCDNPEPQYGGKQCQGLLSEIELCDLPNCPATLTTVQLVGTLISEGKPASQMTTMRDWSNYYPANLAVDGNTDQNKDGNSCSYTEMGENPWWQVDLGSSHHITGLTIYIQRSFNSDLYTGELQVSVGPSSDGNFTDCVSGQASKGQIVNLDANCNERFVKINLQGEKKYLGLCEVKIYGFPINEE